MGELPSSGGCLALQSRLDHFALARGSGRFSRTPPFCIKSSCGGCSVLRLLTRPHLSQVQADVTAPVPSVTGFLWQTVAVKDRSKAVRWESGPINKVSLLFPAPHRPLLPWPPLLSLRGSSTSLCLSVSRGCAAIFTGSLRLNILPPFPTARRTRGAF